MQATGMRPKIILSVGARSRRVRLLASHMPTHDEGRPAMRSTHESTCPRRRSAMIGCGHRGMIGCALFGSCVHSAASAQTRGAQSMTPPSDSQLQVEPFHDRCWQSDVAPRANRSIRLGPQHTASDVSV